MTPGVDELVGGGEGAETEFKRSLTKDFGRELRALPTRAAGPCWLASPVPKRSSV